MKPKWTEQQKTEALEMARSTSIPKAAQLTGIPEGTLKRWRNEEAKRSDHIKPIRSEPVKQAAQSGNELTEKQKAFVQEYLVDLNAKAAAIRAGYSAKTAAEQGHQQLQKPAVKAAIEKAMELRSLRTQITADMVLQELAKVGFSKLGDFVEFGPRGVRIKDSKDVDSAVLAEVSETETNAGTNRKIKLYDKVRALELIGKHLGMFIEKHTHEIYGKDGKPIEVTNHDQLSDDELDALITERVAALGKAGVTALN